MINTQELAEQSLSGFPMGCMGSNFPALEKCCGQVVAALAKVRAETEKEVIERCAWIAEEHQCADENGCEDCRKSIAALIRELGEGK